jgi:arsenical pump membrane protein
LLVGIAAHADGLFELAGRRLELVPGSPLVLLASSLALVTVVTALLNLDTAVVFLTPILVHAARERGTAEEPFLYGAVFMANASSLYLPGSNLTNLLVLAHMPVSGSVFAGRLIVPAAAATLATGTGLVLLFRRSLREPAVEDRGDRSSDSQPFVGACAAVAAAALTVALANAALPVLAVGLAATTTQIARGRLRAVQALRAVGPTVLCALFAAAVALGTLARYWSVPASVLGSAGRFGTAAIGAAAAILVNNLPAAVLLSARPVAHASALLIGLNLGPNLAMTGSLSALLWWRAARQINAPTSVLRYSRLGFVLAPVAICAALGAAEVIGSHT